MHEMDPHRKKITAKVYHWVIPVCLLFSMFVLITPIASAQKQTVSLKSPVTIEKQQLSYQEVFRLLRKQTGYTFFYSNQVLDDSQTISVDFQRTPLSEVLSFLFAKKSIGYEVKESKILLKKIKLPPPVEKQLSTEPVSVADTASVRGTVMDVDGKPLAGVSVFRKGSTRGALTDVLGAFSIQANPGTTLLVSMIGMEDQEVLIPEKGTMKITMIVKPSIQNDVVVVSYGKQSKLTVTGAVSSVNMEDMKTSVPSLTNALAGKVAGVISVQSSGEPGYDNSQFTIRGIGSFTGNTSPLIIVDGVQRDDVNSTYGGAFNNIDPEDISSISLLKDASSTAMYGAKGANGVLIITTKRGVAGKPKISFKAESGL
ncbi:MAG TPA: TonB-dependent receptor plug domain-containing protein, partial [Arachidicoccus sp.]|nr:TonB-dependent receptor plug domain-containing protein [Arachidicoccus sp.]